MKSVKFIFLILLTLVGLSCSEDDVSLPEQEVITEPSMEEMLVSASPWSFTNYEVLEIVETTNESISEIDINNHTNSLLDGFTLNFNEDGTVVLNHPLSGEINRTWVLFEDDIIFDSESNTPQIWKNIQVNNEILSVESTFFTIFEDNFDSVEHYGKLNFE